jgi:hypothetical protein
MSGYFPFMAGKTWVEVIAEVYGDLPHIVVKALCYKPEGRRLETR